MQIQITESNIEEAAKRASDTISRKIVEQASSQVAIMQKACNAAQQAEQEAKTNLGLLDQRIAQAKAELAALEQTLKTKRNAYKQLYGESA